MYSVSFYTLGCNVNVAETERLRGMFEQRGFRAAEGDGADAIIINTCAVTSTADKGARQLLRRLRDKNADAVIAVVGCVGEALAKEGAPALPDADITLGNDKFDVVRRVSALLDDRRPRTARSAQSLPVSARAYLQIENGCDRFCAYCIVPHLRGGPVSTPYADITRELNAMGARGVKEVVLSGVNLALYRDGTVTLPDVLRAADAAPGIERIRLSSLEPGVMTDELLDALPSLKKLCPHFHISLQSGCDATLSAMGRGYTIAQYIDMLGRLRAALPGVAVTTDVIVGFPGESDEHFRDSIRGIVRCEFSDIHIFKYSKREGTAAAGMPGHVTEHKKILRAAQLQGVKQQARYSFISPFVGRTVDVLFLEQRAPGVWGGATPHGIDVRISSEDDPRGAQRAVYIEDVYDTGDGFAGWLV